MVHKALVVTVTLLLLLLASARANACDCAPSKPLSEAIRVDYPYIFEGIVVEIDEGSSEMRGRTAVLEVRRAWKGVTTKRLAVFAELSMCAFWFQIDHSYVVFAWKDEKGNLTSSHCSWTVESSKAAPVLAHLGQATVPK